MSHLLENASRCTVIDSVATVAAPYTVSQLDARDFMLRAEGLSEPLRKRIPQIYERSGINERHTCLKDYTLRHDQFEFYPATAAMTPSPSTGQRNAQYRLVSTALAVAAATESLREAELSADKITHLIVVSCTGFFAPGLDVQLVERLWLPAATQRLMIGFMGCCAAFNALAAAHNICRSQPNAKVLVVCVELCTLHFQISDDLESVIVNALFSDGAAACIIRSIKEQDSEGKLIYRGGASSLVPNSQGAMSWEVGDTGFMMGLSPKVPEIISSALPEYLSRFNDRFNLSPEDIDFWAVHPGGRQVLDRTASVLQLKPDALEDSYSILRDHGNMSSPTILFIIQRIMQRRVIDDRHSGIALGFGPGLTIEGCLLEFGTGQPT
jgi:alpha-pyrone synthase